MTFTLNMRFKDKNEHPRKCYHFKHVKFEGRDEHYQMQNSIGYPPWHQIVKGFRG